MYICFAFPCVGHCISTTLLSPHNFKNSPSHFTDMNTEAKRLTDSPKALLLENSGPFPLHHVMVGGEVRAPRPHWPPWFPPDHSPQELQSPPLVSLRITELRFLEPNRTPREHEVQAPVFRGQCGTERVYWLPTAAKTNHRASGGKTADTRPLTAWRLGVLNHAVAGLSPLRGSRREPSLPSCFWGRPAIGIPWLVAASLQFLPCLHMAASPPRA